MRQCEKCAFRYSGSQTHCPVDGGLLIDQPDPLVGRTLLGRYSLLEKIGAGGMGSVYRARHEVLGRDVAIKFLAEDLALEPAHRQRFLREARAANRINHEHIIDITDFGESEDGLVYLVMEYLDGTSLAKEILKGPMAPRRALKIAIQVAKALARAHELDVVHRDIKPDNIQLVRRDGHEDYVKILDFGLAHMKGELRLTVTGAVFGTAEYMSPEQARGAPFTTSVDLYALGCVLFEMLTGVLPFNGRVPDLILHHLKTPAPAPSSLLPGLSPDLDAIVLKLLDKDAQKRHRDAYHLVEELKAAIDALPSDTGMRSSLISNLPSRPEAKSGAVSRAFTSEDGWAERFSKFAGLLHSVHPGGNAPAELRSLMQTVPPMIDEVRSLRIELDRCAEAQADEQERMKELRLRIGRAIDELGRDESRVLRALQEIGARLEESRRRLGEVDAPLREAWARVPRSAAENPAVSREVATALRDAGSLASAWVELDRAVSAVERDAEEKERERDDLRFQIAQLKGRLATVDAEAEIALTALRDRSSRIDSEMHRKLETIVAGAGVVADHLMRFPEARASLVAAPSSARDMPTQAASSRRTP